MRGKRMIKMFFKQALKALVMEWIANEVMPKVRMRHGEQAAAIETILMDELRRL